MASKPVTIWLTLLACPALLLMACSKSAEPPPPPPPPPQAEPVSSAPQAMSTPEPTVAIHVGAAVKSIEPDDLAPVQPKDFQPSKTTAAKEPAPLIDLYASTDPLDPSLGPHHVTIKNAAIPGLKPVIESPGKSPDQTLDDALDNLANANAAFQHPKEMAFGETQVVTLRLSETETTAELMKDLQETIAASEASVHAIDFTVDANALRVSEVMQAHLVGSSFTVDPISPEVQPISTHQATIWEWNVTPKEFGQLTLTLAMNAKITVAGKERSRFIRTFTETIVVPVKFWNSVGKFFVDNWQWIASTLIIPLFAWYWHQRHKARRRQNPPRP
jgi:hypothetical protein